MNRNKDIFITAGSIIHGMLIDVDKIKDYQEVFVNLNSVLSILLRDDMEVRFNEASPTEIKSFKTGILTQLLDWFTQIINYNKRLKLVYLIDSKPNTIIDTKIPGWNERERYRFRVDEHGKFVNNKAVRYYYNVMKAILNVAKLSNNIETISVAGTSSHIVMHMNIVPGVKTLIISRDQIDYVLVDDHVSFVKPSGRTLMGPSGVCEVVKCKASPLSLPSFFVIAGIKNRYKGKPGYAAGKASKYLSNPDNLVRLMDDKIDKSDMFPPQALVVMVEYAYPIYMLFWRNIIRADSKIKHVEIFESKL